MIIISDADTRATHTTAGFAAIFILFGSLSVNEKKCCVREDLMCGCNLISIRERTHCLCIQTISGIVDACSTMNSIFVDVQVDSNGSGSDQVESLAEHRK